MKLDEATVVAGDEVVAVAGEDHVVPGAGDDHVASVAGGDAVVAVEQRVTRFELDHARGQGEHAVVAHDEVAAVTGVDDVVAGAAEDVVVGTATENGVVLAVGPVGGGDLDPGRGLGSAAGAGRQVGTTTSCTTRP